MNTHRQRWQPTSLVKAESSRKALARKALAKCNGRRYVPEATPESVEHAANAAEIDKLYASMVGGWQTIGGLL